MALMTACPACQTQFKIVPDQLRLHNGLVRCGSCNHVFDASKVLLSVPSQLPAAAPSNESPAWKSKAVVQALIAKPAATESMIEAAPSVMPKLVSGNSKGEHLVGDTTLLGELGDANDAPNASEPAAHGPLARSLLWLAAIGLGLLAAAQLALISRYALASAVPAAQPVLTALCRPLACSVQPARTLAPLFLDSLTLKRTSTSQDLSQPADYALQASISNASTLAVLKPHIELTLTNSQSQTIARRVLSAAELGNNTAALAPRSDWQIKLNLRLDPQTAGFTGRLVGSSNAPSLP